ncbi:hypothetical protein BH10ACT1_BH10ACT1_37420 [soil metagenome]
MVGALGAVLSVLLVVLVVQVRGEEPVDRPTDVYVVGDSITTMAGGRDMGPAGWTVDARPGRTTPEGIDVVAAADLSGASVVIVALGTNDHLDDAATYGRKVDRMMAAIGPGPEVVWVNVDTHTDQLADAARGVNAALDAAVARHPNLRIGDWDAYVATVEDRPGVRAGDGIHYGPAGSELRRAWTVDLVPA